jgi:hypothetical protein
MLSVGTVVLQTGYSAKCPLVGNITALKGSRAKVRWSGNIVGYSLVSWKRHPETNEPISTLHKCPLAVLLVIAL